MSQVQYLTDDDDFSFCLCVSGRTQKQLLECMGSGEKKPSNFER